jgi:hypothetical protein
MINVQSTSNLTFFTATYSALALPSSGAVAFAQGLVCGGVSHFDQANATDSTLDDVRHTCVLCHTLACKLLAHAYTNTYSCLQVTRILDRYGVNPTRVVELLQNTTLDERDLNQTLSELGYDNLTHALDGLALTLPDDLVNLDPSNSSLNSQSLEETISALCALVNDQALVEFIVRLGRENASSLFNNTDSIGGLDLAAIVTADSPQDEFIRQ